MTFLTSNMDSSIGVDNGSGSGGGGLEANHYVIMLTFSCCCLSALLAVFGNTMIIWLIATTKSMRTPTNLFIANLALSDILIGALVIPFQFQTNLLKRWVLPYFMCYTCPTIQVITVCNSVFTLTALALERYRAVMYPLLAHVSKFNAKIEILVIWVLAIGLSVPTIIALKVHLVWDELTDDKTMPFCQNTGLTNTLYGTYNSALVFIQYFIPLCIITYTYVRMAVKLSVEDMETDLSVRVINKNSVRKKRKEKFNQQFRQQFKIVYYLCCSMRHKPGPAPAPNGNVISDKWSSI
ncbi:QRFP-like peptide receptor [Oppia nitens]|uniref:QRFP-like peptide receptor n=1 Tax=Oppia nitens TaxID=1686743 RepID=UPI0023DB18EF|nr:QRFP-like peptide receptor [Oppia nitens]